MSAMSALWMLLLTKTSLEGSHWDLDLCTNKKNRLHYVRKRRLVYYHISMSLTLITVRSNSLQPLEV